MPYGGREEAVASTSATLKRAGRARGDKGFNIESKRSFFYFSDFILYPITVHSSCTAARLNTTNLFPKHI